MPKKRWKSAPRRYAVGYGRPPKQFQFQKVRSVIQKASCGQGTNGNQTCAIAPAAWRYC